jgi:hypothetical protein
MTVCGGWSLVKHSSTGVHGITMWCRAWSCGDCLPRRLAQLKRTAQQGRPSTFLTLTVNPAHGQSPEGRARELVDAMRTMLKRARRRFKGNEIAYLAVFEETKKGEPHLHMLMRAPFIPQRWISDQMSELIEAPIVDIRRVTNPRLAAQYVAKYVAKGPKAFGSLKRYWKTKNYVTRSKDEQERQNEKGSGWRPVNEPLFIVAEGWRTLRRVVAWITDHEIFSGHGPEWGVAAAEPYIHTGFAAG